MKVCNRCKVSKELDDFQKCARNKDGHTGMCKTCKRSYDNDHYKRNPERRQYIRENSRTRIKINQDHVWEYLKTHNCVDCGESDPILLEFDHLRDKHREISVMIHENSLKNLINEIAKCEVRCAHCHRRKTAKDFGWWKTMR